MTRRYLSSARNLAMTDETMPPACGERRRGLDAGPAEPRHVSGHVAALRAGALLTLALAVALVAPARAQENDRLIEALERQNELLQRQNEEMQRQLDLLRDDIQAVKQRLPSAPVAGAGTGAAPVAGPGPVAAAPPLVTSGQDRVKLTISGHIHRAMNVAKDGDRTKVYHVDPDSSNSRFRLVGSAQLIDGVELGTNIEIGVRPNSSGDVSQDNEESGDDFDQRIVEMTVNGRFGKMSFGKGSTASDNTAQVDLSGTNVILYSAVNHPVGGLKFVDEDGELTDVRINDVFNNFDGLGREDRIQYDSPTIAGFSFGTTYASDQRADAAIRWAAEIGDFKAAAAGSIFDPSKAGVDYGWAGSTSILHKETGLNLTFSSGAEKTDSGGDRNQIYLKGGWIANIFDFGSSNFGVHGARTSNLPTPSDDAWTFGAAFVQKLDDFGAELYTKFSIYDLDRDNDASVDQIHALTVGSRVKF